MTSKVDPLTDRAKPALPQHIIIAGCLRGGMCDRYHYLQKIAITKNHIRVCTPEMPAENAAH